MDLEKIAITRLQEASKMSLKIYDMPLIVTTSGGKDSSVCVELAQRAGIPFEILHNHITADAPETVYFIRSEFKRLEELGIKCAVNYPTFRGESTSMWKLIVQMMGPPTRLQRFCCRVLKEYGGDGRFIATGIRWAESKSRGNRGAYETSNKDKSKRIILTNDNDEKRQLFETCQLRAKRVVNPIIEWSDRDVWDYIQAEKIPTNPLYREGFCRVGCIGCPMAETAGRKKEFLRYPKFKQNYIRAFERMVAVRKSKGRPTTWQTGKDVFHWWMEDGVLPGQMDFDDVFSAEASEDEEDDF